MDSTSDEQVEAPQLTASGATLLRNVVAQQQSDRHNTLSARRNARRREADALRAPVPETSENTTREISTHPPDTDVEAGESPWGALVAMGVLLGVFLVVGLSLGAQVTGDDASENVPAIEVAGVSEEAPAVTSQTGETTAEDRDSAVENSSNAALPTAGRSVFDGSLERITPGDIEVIVYDEDPAVDGVYSFALRLKSISTSNEIDTDAFKVVVESESGDRASTFSRFVHATLPVGSSALATVRAEGVNGDQQYLVVSTGTVEIGRVALESGSS